MFDRLKLFFRSAGLVFRHGDVIGRVLSAWNRFPGVEDAAILRGWLRPLLDDAAALALLTKTPIDDAIVLAALRIVEHDRAWAAVHAMVLLARDGGTFKDGILIPETTMYPLYMTELSDTALEILPGCPVLLHAAVGLLLLLLQQKMNYETKNSNRSHALSALRGPSPRRSGSKTADIRRQTAGKIANSRWLATEH